MGATTRSMLVLAGLALVIFAVISMVWGRITYVDGDRNKRSITRAGSPVTFWLLALGFLAGGLALLAVAYVGAG